MLNLLRPKKTINSLKGVDFKKSYSQCGEDIIVDFIFHEIKNETPTYLDIGAHHPTFLNNTYYFYKKGARGISIEPDPDLIPAFKKVRPRDSIINVGIGNGDTISKVDFYIMSSRTLNTFSKEEADRCVSYGRQKIEKVIQVPLWPINILLKRSFEDRSLDFVSIDVEGLDNDIIHSFDFAQYRPKVICIETLSYSEDKSEKKLKNLIDLIISKRYFLYADTYINSIFVDIEVWENR